MGFCIACGAKYWTEPLHFPEGDPRHACDPDDIPTKGYVIRSGRTKADEVKLK